MAARRRNFGKWAPAHENDIVWILGGAPAQGRRCCGRAPSAGPAPSPLPLPGALPLARALPGVVASRGGALPLEPVLARPPRCLLLLPPPVAVARPPVLATKARGQAPWTAHSHPASTEGSAVPCCSADEAQQGAGSTWGRSWRCACCGPRTGPGCAPCCAPCSQRTPINSAAHCPCPRSLLAAPATAISTGGGCSRIMGRHCTCIGPRRSSGQSPG